MRSEHDYIEVEANMITIRQRDMSKMSHESASAGVEIWDVYQGNALVGMYRSESDALRYKALLESGRLEQLQHLVPKD